MSVILMNQEKVTELLSMAKFYHETIAKKMIQSPYFLAYSKLYSNPYNSLSPIENEKILVNDFIARIFWYAFVANKVAYALQYKESIDFFDLNDSHVDSKGLVCTREDFFSALGHLSYNMLTNDGNKFIEEKWYIPFREIYQLFSDANPSA